MNRGKRLIKDIILFGIASMVPKAIGFLMTPLYTSMLSISAYGAADLWNSIESFLLPILMLDISDAVMIFVTERRRNGENAGTPLRFSNRVLSIATAVLMACGILVVAVLRVPDVELACAYIATKFLLDAYYLNIVAYLRGIDNVKEIVYASLVGSLASVVFNVVFIVVLRWGLNGLLLATILGQLVCNIYISKRARLFSICRGAPKATKLEIKEMLHYSTPLILTGIAWWINGTSDRLFVSAFAGVAANGIYAVANKIPSVLNMVHGAIYQAMQLSVFQENDASDRNVYYRKLYETYCLLMTFVASLIVVFTKPLALLLFQGEFYEAWQFVPGLVLASAIFSISGYLTTTLAALRKTVNISGATITGAAANVLLNILLIPQFGVFGAVMATIMGYFLIWILLVRAAIRGVGFHPPIVRSCAGFVVVLAQWFVCTTIEPWYFLLFGPLLVLMLNKSTLFAVTDLMRECISSLIRKHR